MKPGKKPLTLAILLVFCFLLRLYSCNPVRVENGYSSDFFPAFGRFLRASFGKWGFSLGDIIYLLAIIYLLYKLFRIIRFIILTRKFSLYKTRLKRFVLDTGIIL